MLKFAIRMDSNIFAVVDWSFSQKSSDPKANRVLDYSRYREDLS